MNTDNSTEENKIISPVIEEVKKTDIVESEKTESNTHAFELKDLSYSELIDCYVNVHDFIKYLNGLKE